MKFPKSMHAEGWATHLEETRPEHLPDALKTAGPARPAVGPARFKPTGAGAKIDIHAPLNAAVAEVPRVDPAFVRPQPTTANRPAAAAIERDRQMSWMIPAGAGAAIIAAVAIWAMNRPSTAPVTPPALVVGSAEQPTQVADATPAPEATAASQAVDSSTAATTTVADATPAAPAKTEAAEAVQPAPAKLGPPVTTSRPAAESRTLAQAPTPSPRPDMVQRAAPTTPAPTLPPPTTVAVAPVTPAPVDAQPLSVPPGNAPIVMPPTAAGPATAPQPIVAPPAAIPPVASTTPDTAASAAATGTPPLAQATPQPPVQPVVEDSGITVKVRMALAADATLSAVPIAVSTDHGVVKLEGQAPDTQTRERATVVASSAAGVKAVDNRLTLPPATVVSQAPSAQ